MPRRGVVVKREIRLDLRYGDRLVARLINSVMRDGKKNVAERIIYRSLEIIGGKMNDDPLKSLKKAVQNVRPVLEVRSRRVGGSTYQVPVEVRPDRSTSLALRWLIRYAEARGGRPMDQKLAEELMDAAHNRGAAVKKKEDTHKMAEANKAFAHYNW